MAVHAVGGRRDQYRPLRSVWQASASPIALAAALRDGLGADHLYLADLDAIEGRPPDLETYQRISRVGLELWLDAGVRDRSAVEPLLELGPRQPRIVVGLESIGGPADLREIIERAGPDRVLFSLDLDDGRPRLATSATWPVPEPLDIAADVVGLGVRSMIILDLMWVGTARGLGSVGLLAEIRARFPLVSIAVGGGIRGLEDVLELRRRGASAALVGSAIHDGRIGRRELECLMEAAPRSSI